MKATRKDEVYAIFNEKLMGVVSIAILPFFLADVLVGVEELILVAESVIIAVFMIEYGSKLAVAEDKRAFAKQGWEILNLVIILSFLSGTIASIFLPLAALPTTLLRLMRLLRLALFVTRAAGALEFHRLLLKTKYYHIFGACIVVIFLGTYGLLLVEKTASSLFSQIMPKTATGVMLAVTVVLTILVLAAFTVSRMMESFRAADSDFEALRQDLQRLSEEIRKRES